MFQLRASRFLVEPGALLDLKQAWSLKRNGLNEMSWITDSPPNTLANVWSSSLAEIVVKFTCLLYLCRVLMRFYRKTSRLLLGSYEY